MKLQRRQFVMHGAALLLGGLGAARAVMADAAAATAGLASSRVIYLTPLRSDGTESSCQSEIWYVLHNGEIFVSTRMDAWRTQAIKKGLTKTRIWVGDFGVWTSAKEKYRAAPSLMLNGKLETDPALRAQVLEVFGKKYADEWVKWGPRFRDGLADGSRSLLRYQIM